MANQRVTQIAALADETLRKESGPFRVAIDAAGLYSAYEQNPPCGRREDIKPNYAQSQERNNDHLKRLKLKI